MRQPTPSLLAALACSTIAMWCSACSAPRVPLSSYASRAGASSWDQFAAGTEVVLLPRTGGCTELVGDTASADALSETTWPEHRSTFVVETAEVQTGAELQLALFLRPYRSDTASKKRWLYLRTSPRCLKVADGEVRAALPLHKSFVAFKPSLSECARIEARGDGVESLLRKSATTPLQVDGFVALDGEAGAWARLGSGAHVRSDTLASCFERRREGEEVRSELKRIDTLDALRVPEGRCTTDSSEPNHILCNTNVAVWKGRKEPGWISLQLERETLGPLHLLAGKVLEHGGHTGRRYARTVIAVRTDSNEDAASRTVRLAAHRGIANALLADDDVRLETKPISMNGGGGAPIPTVRVDVGEITVSDLGERVETGTSRYKIRDEVRPNPEYAKARARVRRAERAAEDKRRSCQENTVQKEQRCEDCQRMCEATGQTANDIKMCKAACQFCRLASTGCDEIGAADAEADAAADDVESVPRTITVPVMGDWTYTKTIYRRSASAHIEVISEVPGHPAVRHQRDFSQQMVDFHIDADPTHNVVGHEATGTWIEKPESAVALLAKGISQWIADEMNLAVVQTTIHLTRPELAKHPIDVRPGVEDITALAFHIAGTRLVRTLSEGSTRVESESINTIPNVLQLSKQRGACALAVGIRRTSGALLMSARQEKLAIVDARRKPFAHLEVCSRDGSLRGDIRLTSDTPGDVRWAVFETRDGGTPDGTTTGADDRPLPSSSEVEPSNRSSTTSPNQVTPFARLGFLTAPTGSIGSEAAADIFGAGPSVSLGLGARVSRRWIFYGEWEHAFLSVGSVGPFANTPGASAQSDAVFGGGAFEFGDWNASSLSINALVDLGIGYSALAQYGVDDESFVLGSWATRLGVGASMRRWSWFSVRPMLTATLANTLDYQARVRQVDGVVEDRHGRFRDASARVSFGFGVGGMFDVPVGK